MLMLHSAFSHSNLHPSKITKYSLALAGVVVVLAGELDQAVMIDACTGQMSEREEAANF
jgi:hypothetical protein